MKAYPDELLAFLELKQDLLFAKIPREAVRRNIGQALLLGETYYDSFRTQDIHRCYNDHHIEIVRKDDDGSFFKVKFRAQYEFDPRGPGRVILYEKSLHELAQACGLPLETVETMSLAHEFFHFLEHKAQRTVTQQLEPVIAARFLGYRRQAHITRYSEIAAHRFVQHWCQLPYLANYYDYCYLLKYNKINPSYFDEQLEQFNKEYGL